MAEPRARTAAEPPLEEDVADLYEHAPCGYLSALPDGTIVKVNRTFLDWTGHSREALVGRRRFQDLLTPGGRIYHETHYAPLLRMQGEVQEIAVQIVAADGSRVPVLLNSTLRRSEAGEPVLVRTAIFRAADRRTYEQELLRARRREAEARQRTERLQRLTEHLAAALDERQVAAAVAGELEGAVGADGVTVTLLGLDEDGEEVLVSRGNLHPETPSGDVHAAGPEFGTHGCAVPLHTGRGPLGVLRLGFADARELDEEDRSFVVACARQCGQALERARLHGETLRQARRAEALAEAGRALSEATGLHQRAEQLVAFLTEELADAARVDIAGPAGPELVAAAPAGRVPELEPENLAVALRADRPGPVAGGLSIVLPLRARGRVLGTLTLDRSASGVPFRFRELQFLGHLADRAAVALENARLYDHERDVAHALQHSMRTHRLPRGPQFHVAAHYRPSDDEIEVGGDWYDAFALGDGHLGVVVGDVVGRGIEAASAMGQLRSAVRALAGAGFSPVDVLLRLDDFVEHVEVARFATLLYADLDLGTGRLCYACAGHPPPVVVHPGQDPVAVWDGRSAPLGAAIGVADREEAELTLSPGARLLLYTDGLVERRDRSVDVGIDRLIAETAARHGAPLAALVEDLPRALVDPAATRDDVCLLALSFGAETRFERVLPADVARLSGLRADLRAWLEGTGVDRDAHGPVILACSEAVANAMEHGSGHDPDCTVSVVAEVDEEALCVRVRDRGRWKTADPHSERGRGLVLIDQLMDEVHVEQNDGTCVVMKRRLDRATMP